MTPFRTAVEAGDHAAVAALIADDVVSTSRPCTRRITGFTVLVRPSSGLIAVATAMGARRETDPVPA